MKRIVLSALALACVCISAAQTGADTLKTLDAVVVSGIVRQTVRNTPFTIAVLPAQALRANVNYSLSDALRNLPGLSQITTGTGISKPVIRGLYGNRIQTVLLGLRFDNQQWQDEHGLGLSIVGIDRVEVLKGPSSLLYGTEAMGGVIRIIEEKKAVANTRESDLHLQTFSNTYGVSVNAGLKAAGTKTHWRLRAGADSHADYADGANNRVLNTRFASYNLKAGYGFSKKKWTSENNLYTSFSKFGFVMEDNQDRKPVDARLSRRLDGPNHSVFFTILSSENEVVLKGSRLQLNGGAHTNLRLENEGGNRVSLNMLLNTVTYNAKWFKPLSAKTELVLAHEAQAQTNRNFGSRVIIPDANLGEASLSAYVKLSGRNLHFESGISVSNRNVKTFTTQNMAYASGAIYPFSKNYVSANGNTGIAFNPSHNWNLKLNGSTGYRAPNLAELSSNGLHEGSFRFEIGNPTMKAEQNVNVEISVAYQSERVSFSAAVFNNQFRNYIYLAPTGTELYGFAIYRFLQRNAQLQGGEATLQVTPVAHVQISSQFSTVNGTLNHGTYLPFIPANKWNNEVTFSKVHAGLHTSASWRSGVVYVFAQNHPGAFETSTKAYYLVNTALLFNVQQPHKTVLFSLAAENLLNKKYYDHLSRFKYFGIYNQGRTLALSVQIPLQKSPV